MARGFESKSVADQQESADSLTRTPRVDLDPATLTRRRRLELARADISRQIAMARAQAHREMLERALAALDKDLAALG